MKGFAFLDYLVVVGYLCAIAAFGSSFYRRRTTAEEYFLGGRSISWLPAGISIIAADLSAITIMGTPAWNYKHNLELVWSAFGYPLMAPLVIFVFVPFYSKLNLYTAYEYLEKRFSLNVRLLTSLMFHILRGMHVALVIYAPSLVINLVTGLPVWECILFMGCFTTFYTALGGMRAVIWTDVIQFSTVSLGMVLIFYTALHHVSGGAAAAYRTALEAGRLRLFNFSTDPRELTSFWACIIGGSILCVAPLTTDQAVLQRLFTTKSEADCRRSVILQSILVVPITLLLSLTGVALFAYYHDNPGRLAGLTVNDAIMPFFAVRELSAGVSGLVIASIFAASMSVMSAGINSLTTATTVDFYQRVFRPGHSPEHYAIIGRIGTLAWGLVVTLLALLAGRLGELALAYNRVSSVVSGPLLGIFLLGILTRRPTAPGSILGAAVGMAAVALASLRTEWSFFYFGPIGVLTTVTVGYLASLLTKPPKPEKVHGLVLGETGAIGEHPHEIEAQ
jgi:SSS family transporter